ncbi:hypothetical protein Drorol1_Dr00012718 [Drosera rotundifolia]
MDHTEPSKSLEELIHLKSYVNGLALLLRGGSRCDHARETKLWNPSIRIVLQVPMPEALQRSSSSIVNWESLALLEKGKMDIQTTYQDDLNVHLASELDMSIYQDYAKTGTGSSFRTRDAKVTTK